MDNELAAALRAWRERLALEAVGLPHGRRRRTPGLRRAEVASLAGLSVEYLTRLEQGRAKHPSAGVIAPLARTLQLSDAERDHLLVLAGHAPGERHAVAHVTPSVQRILSRLEDTPVHVSDDAWDLIYANDLCRALLGDEFFDGDERNAARLEFLGPPSRVVEEHDHRAIYRARTVAALRASLAASPQRERVREVVDSLLADSPEFAALWSRGDVGRQPNRRKAILHPEVGRIEVDCDVMHLEESGLRIVIYTTTPDSPDASALALLRTIGTQRMDAGGLPR
jgi:transcriptional regulator with XRE-family HTH domain